MKKIAFTLAEVLITLGIIGVVAAMTIPTLVKNYQKVQYVSGLKKSYSQMQQFLRQYVADEGASDFSSTDLFDGTDFSTDARRDKVDKVIRKYFRVAKSCVHTADTSCDMDYSYLNQTGNITAEHSASNYIFQTADGFLIFFALNTTCTSSSYTVSRMKAQCGNFAIDVNGSKPPNRAGRDLFTPFAFWIDNDGTLYPHLGIEYSKFVSGDTWATATSYWGSNTNRCGTLGNPVIPNPASGFGCMARIIEEGWQMSY